MPQFNPHNVRWLRSNPTTGGFAAADIDVENGIIPGVVMVQEGPAKGHGVNLEAEFVEKIHKYDVRHFSKRGLKARFGHPSASGETMGTQLGVFKNFSLRTENGKLQLIADLHLLEASESSPTHPGMRSWVLKMADEQPDFIMSSIVFSAKGYYQRSPNGSKHNLIISKEYYGEPFTNYKEEWGDIFVEFDEHYYTDLVEAGAATDSLFSTTANPHLFVSKVLSWLEEHPELKSFAQQHPEKAFELLRALGIEPKPQKKMKMFNLKELFFGKEAPTEAVTITPEQVAELRSKLDNVEQEFARKQKEFDALKDEVDSLKETLKGKESELAEAQAKITELEKAPAAGHTQGTTGDEGDDKKSFHQDPATKRAIEAYSRRATKA